MIPSEFLLLEILSSALRGVPYSAAEIPEADMVKAVMAKAESQKILPLIYDTASASGILRPLKEEEKKSFRNKAMQDVIRQIRQSTEFLVLLKKLQDRGYDPIVVKGAACSCLYPQPFLRPSVDEDIFVPDQSFFRYPELLEDLGMNLDFPELYSKEQDELSFHKKNSPLYIELHRKLFSSESELFSEFNRCFERAPKQTVHFQMQDLKIRTLNSTDHFLYLILHSFKHFLYSGFGIRMVCDIAIFGHCYHSEINWPYVKEQLIAQKAFDFGRALCGIIHQYIYPDAAMFTEIRSWNVSEVNGDPLLEDILQSGLHGDITLVRLHSAGITLQAVENDRRGKKQTQSLRTLIFPPAKSLTGRYPYLIRNPILLPFAWGQRLIHYAAEVKGRPKTDTIGESLALGRKRVKLLEQYGIIDS